MSTGAHPFGIAAICYNTPRMKFSEDIRAAIRIGLASARANVVPMVVLWAMAGALVVGYYFVPGIERGLEPVRQWQTDCGWVAAFLNRFVFCGILPGVFMLTMKTLSVPRPGLAIAAQTLWSGICGIVSGWMFELHALWFGTGTDFGTLCVKTAMQQFVWTPFFFAPVGALVYFWIGRDFSWGRCKTDYSQNFWWKTVLPNLFANWVVWFPCSMLVHMFPTALQIQLTGFVNAYFCLVLLWIGRRKLKSGG